MKNALVLLSIVTSPFLFPACANTVDPLAGTKIADLTDAEAQSWCGSTFEGLWGGGPQQGEGPVQADGTVNGDAPPDGAGYGGFVGPEMCFLHLPVDQCAANLKLHPCEATLQQLDDCLDMVMHDSDPTTWSWTGCDAYRATPSCGQTILNTRVPSDDPAIGWTCRVPVR